MRRSTGGDARRCRLHCAAAREVSYEQSATAYKAGGASTDTAGAAGHHGVWGHFSCSTDCRPIASSDGRTGRSRRLQGAAAANHLAALCLRGGSTEVPGLGSPGLSNRRRGRGVHRTAPGPQHHSYCVITRTPRAGIITVGPATVSPVIPSVKFPPGSPPTILAESLRFTTTYTVSLPSTIL